MDELFKRYYETNFWNDPESVSGSGSNLAATAVIRKELPTLFTQLGITSLLDISCGDFQWFAKMWGSLEPQLHYIGADIVPDLVLKNRERYVHRDLEFQVLDATKDRLPEVDLIFCRDTLVHFTHAEVKRAIKNFRASGSKYLLATTFPGAPDFDIETGQWHPIDLNRLRYGLGPPMVLLFEHSTPQDSEYANKSLGLWRLN